MCKHAPCVPVFFVLLLLLRNSWEGLDVAEGIQRVSLARRTHPGCTLSECHDILPALSFSLGLSLSSGFTAVSPHCLRCPSVLFFTSLFGLILWVLLVATCCRQTLCSGYLNQYFYWVGFLVCTNMFSLPRNDWCRQICVLKVHQHRLRLNLQTELLTFSLCLDKIQEQRSSLQHEPFNFGLYHNYLLILKLQNNSDHCFCASL